MTARILAQWTRGGQAEAVSPFDSGGKVALGRMVSGARGRPWAIGREPAGTRSSSDSPGAPFNPQGAAARGGPRPQRDPSLGAAAARSGLSSWRGLRRKEVSAVRWAEHRATRSESDGEQLPVVAGSTPPARRFARPVKAPGSDNGSSVNFGGGPARRRAAPAVG